MELKHGKKDSQKPYHLVLHLQSRLSDVKENVRIIKCSPQSHQVFEVFSSIEHAMNTYGPNASKVHFFYFFLLQHLFIYYMASSYYLQYPVIYWQLTFLCILEWNWKFSLKFSKSVNMLMHLLFLNINSFNNCILVSFGYFLFVFLCGAGWNH